MMISRKIGRTLRQFLFENLNRSGNTVSEKPALSERQVRHWNDKGFLVLPGFFDVGKTTALVEEIDKLWKSRQTRENPLVIDVLEGALCGKRIAMRDAPADVQHLSHKLNDLYLVSEAARSLNLDSKLCLILTELLDGAPVICNSLNFVKGSQQPYHFDTYYMPPPVANKLVVTSICLEDWHSDTGPLSYYPGSHLIPPHVFSHGGLHAVDAEMPFAKAYIEGELRKRGLKAEEFVGKAGDVFIWHAQLYHGGRAIANRNLTRRSLVTHYWRAKDLDPNRVAQIGGG